MEQRLIDSESFKFAGEIPQVSLLLLADFSPVEAVIEKLLMALRCEGTNKPCMSCQSCLDKNARASMTVHYYSALAGISKEQVLHIQELVYASGPSVHPSFFIIEGADHLSAVTANSLLKFLEEPPAGVYFVLLTKSLPKTLPTLISRSIVFRLGSAKDVFVKEIAAISSDKFDRVVLANACTDSLQARRVFASENYGKLKDACTAIEQYRAERSGRSRLIDALKVLDYASLALCQRYITFRFSFLPKVSRAHAVELDRNPIRILVADRFAEALQG